MSESGLPAPPPLPIEGAPSRVVLGADGAVVLPAQPSVPLWQRIPKRLMIGGVVVVAIVVFGWVADRGKTDAADLKAGDCFELPGAGDISEVNDQSCDAVHEVEVLAKVALPEGTPWPGPLTTGSDPIADACTTALSRIELNVDNLPDDSEVGAFFADSSGWNDGDRSALCYVYSPTGLLGPVLNG